MSTRDGWMVGTSLHFNDSHLAAVNLYSENLSSISGHYSLLSKGLGSICDFTYSAVFLGLFRNRTRVE